MSETDDDYSDIHDALGILPTDPDQLLPRSPVYGDITSMPQRVAGGVSNLLGITDAVKALRGGMTEDEARNFALGALPMLLPGGRVESVTAKTMGELFPRAGLYPAHMAMTPTEYVNALGGAEKFAKAFPATFRELQPYLQSDFKPGSIPSVAQNNLKSPFKLVPSAQTGDYFVKHPSFDNPIAELTQNDDGTYHVLMDSGQTAKATSLHHATNVVAKALEAGKEKGKSFLEDAQEKAGGTYHQATSDPLSPTTLKQVYTDAWKNGEAPFSAIADHVNAVSKGQKSVYNIISPDTKMAWDQELKAKHGDWLDRGKPLSEPDDETDYTGPQQDYAKHLEPLNWASHQTDPHAFADVPDWLRRHGEELGFNFDVPLWKGGKEAYPSKFPDPMKKDYEKGFFTTPQQKVAEAYGTTLPYVARAQNAFSVDWPTVAGTKSYAPIPMHRLIEAAREQQADLLAIHNIHDAGSYKPQSQYVVLDPSILRAPSAKFNVDDLYKAAPLAGIALTAGYPTFSGSDAPSTNEEETGP